MREAGMRSWLLTVRPSEAEFATTLASGADVVVLEGEPPSQDLHVATASRLVVKIDGDLDALTTLAPWAILAPCSSGADVQRLGAKLAVREARLGLADGATRIVASIGDARGLMNLPSFAGASPRLAALLFEAQTPDLALARGLVVLAAAAANVAAIDGAGDPQRFAQEAALARDAGFDGRIATNGHDVATLNALFGKP